MRIANRINLSLGQYVSQNKLFGRFRLNFFSIFFYFYQVSSANDETLLSLLGEQFPTDNDLCILPDSLQQRQDSGVTWFVLVMFIIKFQNKHIVLKTTVLLKSLETFIISALYKHIAYSLAN